MELRFPNKSHRKTIKIPGESSSLAELMGIEFGDGGINNPWQLVITLNSEADKEYAKYAKSLIEKLFAIKVAVIKLKKRRVLKLVSSSTNLVDYLVSKGAVRGNKIFQQINIPAWIRGKPGILKKYIEWRGARVV